VDTCPLGGPAGDAPCPGGYPQPVRPGVGAALGAGRGPSGGPGRADGGAAVIRAGRGGAGIRTCLPPFGHDGTERRIERPQNPTEQTRCDRGKKKCHTVKNVLLINAALTILFTNVYVCRFYALIS
jgi:hypothetical protein